MLRDLGLPQEIGDKSLPGALASTLAGVELPAGDVPRGTHFGASHAEPRLPQSILGELPLVGFFANGEIACRNLYGYTGVLTVATSAGG